MSVSVKPKVSSVVTYQLPEFVRNDHPKFDEFLTEYYKFVEQAGQPLDVIRKTTDNLDVDKTSDQFLALIKKNVMPYDMANANTVIPDEMLIKHLKELYLSKGTEESYKFVFNTLYNTDIDMEYGKDFVFRTSSNEYLGYTSVILKDNATNTNLLALAGNYVYQDTLSAIVDKVEVYEHNDISQSFTCDFTAGSNTLRDVSSTVGLTVGDIIANIEAFPKNTYIVSINGSEIVTSAAAAISVSNYTINVKEDYYLCFIKEGSITGTIDYNLPLTTNLDPTLSLDVVVSIDVEIKDPGAYYATNMPIAVIGGSGQNFKAVVGEVGGGPVESVYVLSGGTGYSVNDPILFEDPTQRGHGATAVVKSVDGVGCVIDPVLSIASIDKIVGGYGYSIGDVVSLDMNSIDGINPKIVVSAVTSNILTKVLVANGGSGYRYARALYYVDGANYWFTTPTIRNSIITNIPMPAFAVTALPTLYINGSGCVGSFVVTSKAMSGLVITTPGFNYVMPKLELYSDVARTLKVDLTAPKLNFTLNATKGVTGIALYDIIDLPDATYYYKVVEEDSGVGASASIYMGGSITAATIHTNKTFTAAEYKAKALPTDGYAGLGRDAEFYLTYTISSINLVAGGFNYGNHPQYTIDGGSTGFSATPIVIGGAITGVIITNPGIGYPQSATLTITTSTGSGAALTPIINTKGEIESVTISGTHLGYATTDTINIVSSLAAATLTLTSTNGSITGALGSGGKYVRTPIITVYEEIPDDYLVLDCSGVEGSFTITTTGSFAAVEVGHRIYNVGTASYLHNVVVASKLSNTQITIDRPLASTFSGETMEFVVNRGQISEVTVIDHGNGYTQIPTAILPTRQPSNDPDLIDARLLAMGSSIGRITSVKVVDQGINYEEHSLLTSSVVALTSGTPKNFIPGEMVVDPNFVYPGGDYAKGPHGYIVSVDFDKNLILMSNVTDNFFLISEQNFNIITEDGLEVIHEKSYMLNYSNAIQGTMSGSTIDIISFNRANFRAFPSAQSKHVGAFASNGGYTSDSFIKLHDGKRIQDFSYWIKTIEKIVEGSKVALTMAEYKDNVSEMVHPAGFKMYGDAILESLLRLPLSLKIRLDPYGNEVSDTIIISFALETAALLSSIDFTTLANNNANYSKYKELVLIIDKYIQLFRDVNYDTASGTAFKYRAIELLTTLTKLNSTMNHIETIYDVKVKFFEEGFESFDPVDLERIKFTIRPYEGMVEEPHVVDSGMYNFMPGFTHTQNDLNYPAPNAAYWTYPNTPSSVFDAAVITDFDTNIWSNKTLRNYVPDLYVVIAVKTV